MERAGVPRKVAMMIVGHRTEAMYRRYDIVTESDLHAAAVKLNTTAAEALYRPERPPWAGAKLGREMTGVNSR